MDEATVLSLSPSLSFFPYIRVPTNLPPSLSGYDIFPLFTFASYLDSCPWGLTYLSAAVLPPEGWILNCEPSLYCTHTSPDDNWRKFTKIITLIDLPTPCYVTCDAHPVPLMNMLLSTRGCGSSPPTPPPWSTRVLSHESGGRGASDTDEP